MRVFAATRPPAMSISESKTELPELARFFSRVGCAHPLSSSRKRANGVSTPYSALQSAGDDRHARPAFRDGRANGRLHAVWPRGRRRPHLPTAIRHRRVLLPQADRQLCYLYDFSQQIITNMRYQPDIDAFAFPCCVTACIFAKPSGSGRTAGRAVPIALESAEQRKPSRKFNQSGTGRECHPNRTRSLPTTHLILQV